MKKIYMAILAALVLAGGITFMACNKDNDNVRTPINSNFTTQKSAFGQISQNPYEFVGILHNEGLDYIAKTCDMSNLTKENIHNAVKEFSAKYLNTNRLKTLTESTDGFVKTDEICYLMLFDQKSAVGLITKDSRLGHILDQMNSLFINIYISKELTTPDELASNILLLEKKVLDMGLHNDLGKENTVNEYSATLATLSIAKYSYLYWYNAINDVNNPWHKIVIETPEDPTTNCFKNIWSKIVSIGETIVDVAVTVGKGIATPFVDAYHGFNDTNWETDSNGNSSADLFEFLGNSIEGSAAFWD